MCRDLPRHVVTERRQPERRLVEQGGADPADGQVGGGASHAVEDDAGEGDGDRAGDVEMCSDGSHHARHIGRGRWVGVEPERRHDQCAEREVDQGTLNSPTPMSMPRATQLVGHHPLSFVCEGILAATAKRAASTGL